MRSCWNEDPRKRPSFRTLCDVMEVFVQAAADTVSIKNVNFITIICIDLKKYLRQNLNRDDNKIAVACDPVWRSIIVSLCTELFPFE